ncbi:hypothetical protein GCM10008955_37780 [Deinococcus malanensis]|uniref:N-acetyltransferase n=1 Tax=Deinococcus malanensis TaxID=1706855 RepID=A0ABQ2F229_9DEIO|nr:hypothetical protein GCM10008955_37780 [Deinococcus malanensis]
MEPGSTFCIIQPENTPSLRLAGNMGFHPERMVSHAAQDWQVLLRHDRQGTGLATV